MALGNGGLVGKSLLAVLWYLQARWGECRTAILYVVIVVLSIYEVADFLAGVALGDVQQQSNAICLFAKKITVYPTSAMSSLDVVVGEKAILLLTQLLNVLPRKAHRLRAREVCVIPPHQLRNLGAEGIEEFSLRLDAWDLRHRHCCLLTISQSVSWSVRESENLDWTEVGQRNVGCGHSATYSLRAFVN